MCLEAILVVIATIGEGQVGSLRRAVVAEDDLRGLLRRRVVLFRAVPRPLPNLVAILSRAKKRAVDTRPVLALGVSEVVGRRIGPCPTADSAGPGERSLEESTNLILGASAEVRDRDVLGLCLANLILTCLNGANGRTHEQADLQRGGLLGRNAHLGAAGAARAIAGRRCRAVDGEDELCSRLFCNSGERSLE